MDLSTPSIPRRVRGRSDVILLHRLPNRLRLGLPALRDGRTPSPIPTESGEDVSGGGLAEALETAVGAVEGVTNACANPVTGTLLVEHDGAPGREAAILAALYDVLPAIPSAIEEPRLLADLRRAGHALDEATLRTSNGWIDLKTTTALLLGLYGVSLLLTERPFRLPSGLTMVWWAYNSMRQLAQESRR